MYDSATLEEKDNSLDRQMIAIARGDLSLFVCPFCGTMSDVAADPCCAELFSAKERRGIRNIKSIERQRNGVIHGLRDCIECPYCGRSNNPHAEKLHPSEWIRPMASPFCCDMFEAAITAVMYAVIEQRRIEHFQRIQDGIAKAECN